MKSPIKPNNPISELLGVLLFACIPFSAIAIPNGDQEQNALPAVWIYGTTANWYISQDVVYCNRMDYWTFGMTGTAETIEGKTYDQIESAPLVLLSMTRRNSDGNGLNSALGIRREGGRVLVNYKQYKDYLHHSYDGEVQNPSFGNPDYIPYHLTEDGELVLYDYNMKVGEKYRKVEGYDEIEVTAKDSVMLSDDSRRCRLTLSNGLVLIEGLGCINSNGRLLDYLNPAKPYENNFTYLVSAIDKNGELLYKDTIWLVKESEGADIRTEKEGSDKCSSVYDLQGRRINGKPSKGVYIESGRKVVTK